MKVTKFSASETKKEGKKYQIDIAQIKEILKILKLAENLLSKKLYKLIRKISG